MASTNVALISSLLALVASVGTAIAGSIFRRKALTADARASSDADLGCNSAITQLRAVEAQLHRRPEQSRMMLNAYGKAELDQRVDAVAAAGSLLRPNSYGLESMHRAVPESKSCSLREPGQDFALTEPMDLTDFPPTQSESVSLTNLRTVDALNPDTRLAESVRKAAVDAGRVQLRFRGASASRSGH
jgi:hypothetical protein